jgi:hypothetical protein
VASASGGRQESDKYLEQAITGMTSTECANQGQRPSYTTLEMKSLTQPDPLGERLRFVNENAQPIVAPFPFRQESSLTTFFGHTT